MLKRRYIIEARRWNEEKWSDWCQVDDAAKAEGHANHVRELGYDARVRVIGREVKEE